MSGLVGAVGRHLVDRIKEMPGEVGQALDAKIQQGATEVSNALFNGTSNAYSPYTADNAAYRAQLENYHEERATESDAHRAQFQSQDDDRGMDR